MCSVFFIRMNLPYTYGTRKPAGQQPLPIAGEKYIVSSQSTWMTRQSMEVSIRKLEAVVCRSAWKTSSG